MRFEQRPPPGGHVIDCCCGRVGVVIISCRLPPEYPRTPVFPVTFDLSTHVVFCGGGTGGHLFPGLAVAERLAADWRQTAVSFAGVGKPWERRLVAAAGFDYVPLRASGSRGGFATCRRFSPRIWPAIVRQCDISAGGASRSSSGWADTPAPDGAGGDSRRRAAGAAGTERHSGQDDPVVGAGGSHGLHGL